MGLDSHRKDRFLPFVDRRELVNAIIKFLESGVKIWFFFPKEGDKNSGVVMESISPNLEEGIPTIFIYPRRFPKLDYPILNANSF